MPLHNPFKSHKDKDTEHAGIFSGGSKPEDNYEPPAGPPPGYSGSQGSSSYPQQTKQGSSARVEHDSEYAPPPGPPPTYHNWQSIPDTSLLPPPPAFEHDSSSTSNADSWMADAAWRFTDQYPPFHPEEPQQSIIHDVRTGNLSLRPPGNMEKGESLSKSGSLSYIKTGINSKDHCYLSSLPLYFERIDSPFRTEVTKTIYYELRITSLQNFKDGTPSSTAIGYCVAPYPTWRMPGWQRGSLAVHSDDGSRYMSHDGGGADFTQPIVAGETVGLGIRFTIPRLGPQMTIDVTGQPLTGEVFFTRNGNLAGGWNIQEDLDREQSWRADFLDGKWDLYAAIGTYGAVEVYANFGGERFQYDPSTFTGVRA